MTGLVIWDWDGTIVDSVPTIVSSVQVAASEVGARPPAASEIQPLIGLALWDIFSTLFADQRLAIEVMERYRSIYRQLQAQPFEGMLELLQSLQKKGVSQAVATGKRRPGLDRQLTFLGLENFFSVTVCADESAGKPDPLMLQQILAEYNGRVDKVLMVGDSVHDVKMAQSIGMPVVAVSWGAAQVEDFRMLGKITIAHSVDELELKIKEFLDE